MKFWCKPLSSLGVSPFTYLFLHFLFKTLAIIDTYKLAFFFFSIHESRSLVSVLENHLKPGPWKHQLSQFCEQPLDSLKLFIRKNPKVLSLFVFFTSYCIRSNMGWWQLFSESLNLPLTYQSLVLYISNEGWSLILGFFCSQSFSKSW